MKRAVAVLVVLMMLAVPVMGAETPVVTSADTITIVALERGSDKPALYTCYSLQDLAGGNSSGGGQGTACDGNANDGDGAANGTVIVTTPPTGECNLCRVTQSLPPQPAGTNYNGPKPVSGSIYLTELPQDGPPGETFTFRNYLKSYIVVTMINAKTGKKLKGACIGVSRPDQAGSGRGICDGNPNGGDEDQDGRRNGKITTKRLPTTDNTPLTHTWRVSGSTPNFKAKAVDLVVEPAKTGEFEKATLKFRRMG